MMVDSIASSKFLSEAKTKTLIQKLETLCSSYQARALNREVTLANRVKSMNNTIHINVDQLHAAIAENTQVKFRYFDYDLNKQRRYFKKGECYVVSPWRMLYADDNYYLLAWDAKEEKFKHFRVDKMDGVAQVLLGNIRVAREGAEAFSKLDMSAYTKYTFSMFGGEIEHVTMIFQNRMMGSRDGQIWAGCRGLEGGRKTFQNHRARGCQSAVLRLGVQSGQDGSHCRARGCEGENESVSGGNQQTIQRISKREHRAIFFGAPAFCKRKAIDAGYRYSYNEVA